MTLTDKSDCTYYQRRVQAWADRRSTPLTEGMGWPWLRLSLSRWRGRPIT